jgi:4-hydroxy-3-methylbut-2-enyl diphosphate reductase
MTPVTTSNQANLADAQRGGVGRVLLAAPRGTCAGVDRAVRAVEQAITSHGGPVYVRRHIVHNNHTVSRLEGLGAIFVNELDEVPEGAVVFIPAHGAAPSVYADAQRRGLRTVDATCPLVSKIHNEARRLVDDGYHIVYIGQQGHDEVVGVVGEAPEQITVVSTPEDVDGIKVHDPERLAWLSQTTLSVDEATHVADQVRTRFPRVQGPASDDICYAAQNRQRAVRAIANTADVVLVVGSSHSHNSAELVRVARAAGAPAAYLVDGFRDIDLRWLADVYTVGLTSGASVPDSLVQDVLAWLATHGFTTVETMETTREGMRFAPPRDLLKLIA